MKMKNKKWIMTGAVAVLAVTLLAGVLIGRLMAPGVMDEEVSDWLEAPQESQDTDLKQKNLELLGQVILLKKMLGEIDGEVVLLGPAGTHPIARGRLVWDPARMEGFIHAVHLTPHPGKWYVQGYLKGQLQARAEVGMPDRDGLLQEIFKPDKRLLAWDEFRLIHIKDNGEPEVALVGKRSL